MSNYIKATDFASKDSLSTGSPAKVVKGAEINVEFNAIQTAIATKADLNSPILTGVPEAPKAAQFNDSAQIASTAYVQEALRTIYPVGSIYINATNSTNPATLFGFGTWVAFGTGRTLVGINTANTLMDVPEETFGTADSTLVSHNHTTDSSGNIINGSISIVVESAAGGFSAGTGSITSFGAVSGQTLGKFAFSGTYYQGFSIVGGNHAHTTTTVGSSATNQNYQPSIVVYMWKRTA